MFDTPEWMKGGRGECRYCKEMHNNVAYHEAFECPKSPEGTSLPATVPQTIIQDLIQTPATLGLQIKCSSCNDPITIPAALLFSPPDANSTVKKYHLCQECFEDACFMLNLLNE